MNDKQLKVGVLLSYLQMALNIIIGLIYTPLMMRLLGQSEYGLYNTVASTISMLSILNLGFSSSYIKYFAKYKTENDQIAINKLNGLFLIIFIIIGAIAFACGLFLTFHLDIVFNTGLTSSELKIAKTLMLLLTINLAISFPMSVFSNIISANERFIFLKLLGMLKTVGGPLVTIPLLLLGKGSIGVVTTTLLISLIVDAVCVYYVLCILRNRFLFRDFEKGIFTSLFGYTAFIAINIIVDQINWNIDKILLGRYKGTVAVAIYSVGSTLQTYYQMFSTAISGLFTPRIHQITNSISDIREQNKKISDLFVRIGRIQYLILGLVCLELIFFGKEFIKYWAGPEYDDAYYVALLLIIPVTIPLIQNLGIEIQRAQNKHRFRSFAYATMALINLLLSIYLCQIYGPTGAAFGTTISLLLANGMVMNFYYQKRCGIDVVRFWKNIIRMSAGFIIPVLIGILMRNIMKINGIIILVAGISILAVTYLASMWIIGLNKEEKGFVKTILKKMFWKT